MGQRECPRNERLRRDDGCQRGDDEHGVQVPRRDEPEERVVDSGRLGEEQRALAQVVEQQRGEDHDEPDHPDGAGPEVPHVGVKRLATGDDQDHRAKDDERQQRMGQEEGDGVRRAERQEDFRMQRDPPDPDRGDADEPEQHDPAERATYLGRTMVLEIEQEPDDHGREDNDGLPGESWCRDLESLDRSQHGDRRRDNAIAVEECPAEQPQHDERGAHGASALVGRPLEHQGEEGEDAALAAVVGPQNEADVLHGHHEQQRPDDQRQDAVDVAARDLEPVVWLEALLDRVERAGPDVPVDDA